MRVTSQPPSLTRLVKNGQTPGSLPIAQHEERDQVVKGSPSSNAFVYQKLKHLPELPKSPAKQLSKLASLSLRFSIGGAGLYALWPTVADVFNGSSAFLNVLNVSSHEALIQPLASYTPTATGMMAAAALGGAAGIAAFFANKTGD